MSKTEAIVLATLTSAFPWLMFLCRHMAFMRAFLAGMRLRCAYSGLVFRKVCKECFGKVFRDQQLLDLDHEIIDRSVGTTLEWKDRQSVDQRCSNG